MLSSAFLSRIGSPILFEPLEGEALVAIVSRAIREAILAAAKRLHLAIEEVVVLPDVAQTGARFPGKWCHGLRSSHHPGAWPWSCGPGYFGHATSKRKRYRKNS